MRLLRRTHLYSGLALLPWVLLYGISGFLFNHGSSSPDRQVEMPATAAQDLALAERDLASRLLAAIEPETDAADVQGRVAGTWTFEYTENDKHWRLTLPLDGGDGVLRERRRRTSTSQRIDDDLFADEQDRARGVAEAALAGAGIEATGLRLIAGPSLRLHDDSKRWSASLTRDRVTVSDNDSSFDLGRLLRRLHVTHGYRGSQLSRIVWAVFVDAMAFAMVLWSISGIAMWWQKRSMRTSGLISLTAALLVCTALAFALHALFND